MATIRELKADTQSLTAHEEPYQEGATCERGVCPPSHRAARKISTIIIAVLGLAVIACSVYLWWSQSQ